MRAFLCQHRDGDRIVTERGEVVTVTLERFLHFADLPVDFTQWASSERVPALPHDQDDAVATLARSVGDVIAVRDDQTAAVTALDAVQWARRWSGWLRQVL